MAERALSAAALAALNLPGLAGGKRAINARAQREGWAFESRAGRGGGRVFLVSALPTEAQRALALRLSAALAPPALPALDQFADERGLKDHQRRRLEARAVILGHVAELVAEGFTRAKAIEAVVEGARAGSLRPEVMTAIRVANARGNADRTLSRATLYAWFEAREQGLARLAPKTPPERDIPPWAEALLAQHNRPSKPSLTDSIAALAADGHVVSYGQARRFLKRMSSIDRAKGRLGPREMKGVLPFVRRDVAKLKPGSVFIGDGHTFKAEIAHPMHGHPFRPEITSIIDVRTRRWVGWSVALAENTWSVADALRHAVTTSTLCEIFYYDNGRGANNATWDDDVTGLCARLGITKMNSTPYNSQARGVVERFHSSVMHKLARELPTYVGPRMDKEARHEAFKLTRRDLKRRGGSALLIAWDDFKSGLEAARQRYNAAPHSSLGVVVDLAGRRAHKSPDRAWRDDMEAGWAPEPLALEAAKDLFRPSVKRQVARGEIRLFNNVYFDPALAHYHGDEVIVGYDIHDPAKVIVRAGDGRMICEAEWNANRRDYLPVAVIDAARDRRLAGRLKRLDVHRDEALAEASPQLQLAQRAMPAAPVDDGEAARLAALEAELAAPRQAAPDPEAAKRERFRRALAVERGEVVGADERAWLDAYRRLPEYRSLRGMFEEFGDAIFDV